MDMLIAQLVESVGPGWAPVIVAGLAGALGGGLGALVDRGAAGMGRYTRGLFAIACAVIAVVAVRSIDLDTRAGKSGFSSLSPGQFEDALTGDPTWGPAFDELKTRGPKAFDEYLQWMHEAAQQALREGHRDDELRQVLSARAGIFVDTQIRRLPNENLRRALELRIGSHDDLAAIDGRLCPGTMPLFVAELQIEAQSALARSFPDLIALAFGPERSDGYETMDEAAYNITSHHILEVLAKRHGEALGVFTGATPLTEDNALAYCEAERDFFREVNKLPPEGEREAYYRALAAAILAQ